MSSQWTTKEVAILRTGMSINELSKVLGRSKQAVRNAANRHGVRFASSTGSKVSAEEIAQMMMLRESGWKWKQIALVKGKTSKACRLLVERAKKSGFDKYPKRAKL